MNTRKHDFEVIDNKRITANTKESKKHFEALQVQIYEQMKDPYLEKLRTELTDALKAGDFKKYVECHNKVVAYANTPEYRRKIARAIAKVSESEAQLFWDKR